MKKGFQITALAYAFLVSAFFIFASSINIYDSLPRILGEKVIYEMNITFEQEHWFLVAVWLLPSISIWIAARIRELGNPVKWSVLSSFSLSIILPVVFIILMFQIDTMKDNDENSVEQVGALNGS